MKKSTPIPFEEVLDEAITVIGEEFRQTINECDCVDEVNFAIREELRMPTVDFIKVIALALAGEALSGTR